MYYIVEVNCFIRSQIDVKGKPNKYGEKKLFKTKKAAEEWINKRSYKGMSFKYEIIRESEH